MNDQLINLFHGKDGTKLLVEPVTASSLMSNRTFNQDEWLFGWDHTPGIVSVWAERSGKALLWQRLPGQEQVSCQPDSFRSWLFATTLPDLSQLGSDLHHSSPAEAAQANLPFSYQTLAGPSSNTFRYLLSATDGQALEREILKGARKRTGKEISSLRDLPDDYLRVGPVE